MKRVAFGEPFSTECSARRDSLTNERISETLVLVNTMEKIAPAEFSIREFGSVSVLGSQIPNASNAAPHWLTAFLPKEYVR